VPLSPLPEYLIKTYPLQGYLAHKKHPSPRSLQQDYTQGLMVVLGAGAISYERGTPVASLVPGYQVLTRSLLPRYPGETYRVTSLIRKHPPPRTTIGP